MMSTDSPPAVPSMEPAVPLNSGHPVGPPAGRDTDLRELTREIDDLFEHKAELDPETFRIVSWFAGWALTNALHRAFYELGFSPLEIERRMLTVHRRSGAKGLSGLICSGGVS